jgi:hypothetical protein
MNTKLKFAFEKETKGAVRYQEVGEDGAPAFAPQVGTLYIRKKRNAGRQNPENTYCYNRRRTNLISEARVEETREAVRVCGARAWGAQDFLDALGTLHDLGKVPPMRR